MHWILAIGLLDVLAAGVAGDAGPRSAFAVPPLRIPAVGLKAPEPAPSVTLRTTRDDVVCSLRVWVANPNLDHDITKTAPSDVDPGMVRRSACRPTEVRRMSPHEPSDPPRR